MSFFDDEDEPRAAGQTPPRRGSTSGPRRSGGERPSRGGTRQAPVRPSSPGRRSGPPPIDQAAIRNRRLGLGIGGVIVVILMVIGIRGCEVSARNTALRDYNNSVYRLINQSATTGTSLFKDLQSTGGQSGAANAKAKITTLAFNSQKQLDQAQAFSVPDQMSVAQRTLLLALQERTDALNLIAGNIEQAVDKQGYKTALGNIAAAMARILSSDVTYSLYAAKEIAQALHSVGISVGGTSSQQIAAGQILKNLGWLSPAYIAGKIGAAQAAAISQQTGPLAPGAHGDKLVSVAEGGSTLDPATTNQITASPPPTFTLSVLDSGDNTETDVGCTVTVAASPGVKAITGRGQINQITAGATETCTVTLPSAPPAGMTNIIAMVDKVRGETNLANNKLTFPSDIQ